MGAAPLPVPLEADNKRRALNDVHLAATIP
jgi:hypothetical protein